MAAEAETSELTTDRDRYVRLLRLATYASVTTAAILIAAKGAAWLMTGSVSLLTTMIESLMDLAASVINLFAVRHALQPADSHYRFGYGKAEPLAGLGQAAFVAGSAVFLIIEAIDRLITPKPIVNEAVGIAVMLFSMIVTFVLIRFQGFVVRQTRSLAVNADSLHYRGDFLIHGGVILSLLLSAALGWQLSDPLFGIAIALYILFNAKTIAAESLHILMDRELEESERRRIRAIVLAHPEVIDIHDLRTRSSGPRVFIQFHLELPPHISLTRAHEISDAVEAKLRAAFPNAGVIIHQDPEGVMERRAVFAGEREESPFY
jgi:ferrous-iron efflux pump FieF